MIYVICDESTSFWIWQFWYSETHNISWNESQGGWGVGPSQEKFRMSWSTCRRFSPPLERLLPYLAMEGWLHGVLQIWEVRLDTKWIIDCQPRCQRTTKIARLGRTFSAIHKTRAILEYNWPVITWVQCSKHFSLIFIYIFYIFYNISRSNLEVVWSGTNNPNWLGDPTEQILTTTCNELQFAFQCQAIAVVWSTVWSPYVLFNHPQGRLLQSNAMARLLRGVIEYMVATRAQFKNVWFKWSRSNQPATWPAWMIYEVFSCAKKANQQDMFARML